MDARLSHALVALVAVGVTVAGYTIVDGVTSTVRGLAGDGRPVVRVERPEPKPEGDRDKKEPKKEGKGDPKEPREPRGADEGGKGGGGPLVARAEELGVDPRDLREQRALDQGMTLEQYKRRKQGRSEWRAKQDPEDLVAKRDARHERKEAAMAGAEEGQPGVDLRQLRQDVGDLDPTLRDAAGVLRQLRELGAEAE